MPQDREVRRWVLPRQYRDMHFALIDTMEEFLHAAGHAGNRSFLYVVGGLLDAADGDLDLAFSFAQQEDPSLSRDVWDAWVAHLEKRKLLVSYLPANAHHAVREPETVPRQEQPTPKVDDAIIEDHSVGPAKELEKPKRKKRYTPQRPTNHHTATPSSFIEVEYSKRKGDGDIPCPVCGIGCETDEAAEACCKPFVPEE